MKKEYQKPDVVEVVLVSEEIVTSDENDIVDGDMGLESSIF